MNSSQITCWLHPLSTLKTRILWHVNQNAVPNLQGHCITDPSLLETSKQLQFLTLQSKIVTQLQVWQNHRPSSCNCFVQIQATNCKPISEKLMQWQMVSDHKTCSIKMWETALTTLLPSLLASTLGSLVQPFTLTHWSHQCNKSPSKTSCVNLQSPTMLNHMQSE